MPQIRIEKSELEASKKEKLDLIRSIEEYRRVLAIRKNRIANLGDIAIDLHIKIDELMESIARYQQSTEYYSAKLDKLPGWVKKLYKV